MRLRLDFTREEYASWLRARAAGEQDTAHDTAHDTPSEMGHPLAAFVLDHHVFDCADPVGGWEVSYAFLNTDPTVPHEEPSMLLFVDAGTARLHLPAWTVPLVRAYLPHARYDAPIPATQVLADLERLVPTETPRADQPTPMPLGIEREMTAGTRHVEAPYTLSYERLLASANTSYRERGPGDFAWSFEVACQVAGCGGTVAGHYERTHTGTARCDRCGQPYTAEYGPIGKLVNADTAADTAATEGEGV